MEFASLSSIEGIFSVIYSILLNLSFLYIDNENKSIKIFYWNIHIKQNKILERIGSSLAILWCINSLFILFLTIFDFSLSESNDYALLRFSKTIVIMPLIGIGLFMFIGITLAIISLPILLPYWILKKISPDNILIKYLLVKGCFFTTV